MTDGLTVRSGLAVDALETIDMTGVMRGMWAHEALDSASVVNRLGYAFRIHGPFDLDDYKRAVQDRVAAHPLLRTSVLVATASRSSRYTRTSR